jgi:hypothetical protein
MRDFLANLAPNSPEWVRFWKTLEFGRDEPGVWLLVAAALAVGAAWVYRRDAAALPLRWRLWLTALRLATIGCLFIVALLPQERRSRTYKQPSKVAVLVDTSASMSIRDLAEGTQAASQKTRSEQVRELLAGSPLIETLRQKHLVRVLTFDSKLVDRTTLVRKTPVDATSPGTNDTPALGGGDALSAEAKPDWAAWLAASGVETRLGESLLELVKAEADETLSGIVIVTDGAANAGVDIAAPLAAARTAKAKLFPVGVGGTKRPVNLQVAGLQSPSLVHLGDTFTLTALVAGQGLAGERVKVELLSQGEGAVDLTQVAESDAVLPADGVPVSVNFDLDPQTTGRVVYTVRVRANTSITELIAEDNTDRTAVDVIDRKTRVLVIAGGPMRDYQLVRNLLFRDKAMEIDVLLQTAANGTSQESRRMLAEFPSKREELFEYDVIVGFDPDWTQILGNDTAIADLLAEWVFAQSGGMILVAGDVHTPQLAAGGVRAQPWSSKLLELYPVVLDATLPDVEDAQSRPLPVEFTPEGDSAGFLQVMNDPEATTRVWKEFPGVYRVYPTDGKKSAATIYARVSESASGGEPPAIFASQFYGSGRVLYIGSPEMWRLRGVDENAYDRLWIKMVREAGQGRLLRGTNRGLLLVEKKSYPLGATVQVRARLLDPQFRDLVAESVGMTVRDPAGRPLAPGLELAADKSRAGSFGGAFVASQPGTWSLELAIPDSTETVRDTFTVKLPNLEFDQPEQNVELLRTLANEREGGGKYLALSEAATALPALLEDRTIEKVQFETPRALWDHWAVMVVLATLLSLEWLSRKLLSLA